MTRTTKDPSSLASEAPCLLEVRDVTKRFGDKTVLDGVSLRVERGETVVIIGGSGCGKTTLARLMIGLDRPSSGQILFDGVDLASLSERELTPLRSRFGMVFQRAALLDSLSVFDNVAFPLREETELDEDAIRARVVQLLEELDIAQAADKLPGELSGGMAKRVGIARAMATQPELLVCDEPTSGLDPITSRTVDGLIEQMRERFFVTSIVVTHDMVTAYQIADRVVLLARGKIVANDTPARVFRSHGADILPFAVSSGVDLERLAPRPARRSASEIRALWMTSHPEAAHEETPWYRRWPKLSG